MNTPEEAYVFFDYLSFYTILNTIATSTTGGYIVVIAIIILSLVRTLELSAAYEFTLEGAIWELLIAHVVQLVSILLGVVLVYLLATEIDTYEKNFFYYSNLWLLSGVYVLPFLFVLCLGPTLYLIYREIVVCK